MADLQKYKVTSVKNGVDIFFVDTFVIGSAREQLGNFLRRNPTGYKPYYRNLSSFGPTWEPLHIVGGV